jgi:hypothetical protein
MPSYSGVFTLQAQMQAIAAGTWTGLPIPIGSAYQGGFYAGQINQSGTIYNLVVGPVYLHKLLISNIKMQTQPLRVQTVILMDHKIQQILWLMVTLLFILPLTFVMT